MVPIFGAKFWDQNWSHLFGQNACQLLAAVGSASAHECILEQPRAVDSFEAGVRQ